MNLKNADQIHIPSLHIYKYLESVEQLDKTENKFLLNWELERLTQNEA